MEFYKGKTFTVHACSTDDFIYRSITRSGTFYEIDLLEHIKASVRREPGLTVAADIGANIGNHAIFLGNFVADHIIAVEANPQVSRTLAQNLNANLNGYTVVNQALAERHGDITLVIPEATSGNSGMAFVDETGTRSGLTIKSTTFDRAFAEWSKNNPQPYRLSIIKMDIEGMELKALKGALETIKTHQPEIFVEAATNQTFQSISELLSPLAYHPVHSSAATPVIHFTYRPNLYRRLRFQAFRRVGYYWFLSRLKIRFYCIKNKLMRDV